MIRSTHSEPLVKVLAKAIAARRRLKEINAGRKDWYLVNMALMAGEKFLASYPGASDATCKAWGRANELHLDGIFTSKTRHIQRRFTTP